MEKRLLLSMILSFAVLYAWSMLTYKPPASPPGGQTEHSQHIDIKEVGELSAAQSGPWPSTAHSPLSSPSSSVVSEKKEMLESENLSATFSNVGGVLDSVVIKKYESSMPVFKIGAVKGYEAVPFRLKNKTDSSIEYIYEDETVRISKQYRLVPGDFLIEEQVTLESPPAVSNLADITLQSFVIDTGENEKSENGRDKTLFEYAVFASEKIHRKGSAFKFSDKEHKIGQGPVKWTGFRDRYFCALVKPEFDVQEYQIDPQGGSRLDIFVKPQSPGIGGTKTFSSLIFVGPQDMGLLKSYGQDFEKIMVFSGFGLFDAFSKIIYKVMHLVHKIVPNWGVTIILISILIYFLMYPLTARGMLSMRKMQALQPEMALLKEKHKNNPQKMNKEVMELYKKHRINPLGGCLPFLLQMPVFIGFYQVLWRTVSFKGADFLWIKDLAEPDRLFILPFQIPFLGNELNILPVFMMVIMFFQQKFSSKNMVVSDPAQKAQQRMMGTIFPVFLGVIFYKFASGLTLYFTMFYLFSTWTQWKMSKVTKGT